MQSLIQVHGYNHRPGHPKHGPERVGGNFPTWEAIFTDHSCIRFAWDSALQGRDVLRAWGANFLNPQWPPILTTYGYAYNVLAERAADQLADRILWAWDEGGGKPVDIVCHSLGSWVVLQAIDLLGKDVGGFIRRVLIMHGAVTIADAMPIIEKHKDIKFLSVGAYTDDIVKQMGATFEPRLGKFPCLANGIQAAGYTLPANLIEIILDDTGDKLYWKDKKGWDLRGDGKTWGDHDSAYKFRQNHDMLRAWFRREI